MADTMTAELAYCVKCRQKTPIADAEEIRLKDGRPALKGNCSKCGSGIYRICSEALSPERGSPNRRVPGGDGEIPANSPGASGPIEAAIEACRQRIKESPADDALEKLFWRVHRIHHGETIVPLLSRESAELLAMIRAFRSGRVMESRFVDALAVAVHEIRDIDRDETVSRLRAAGEAGALRMELLTGFVPCIGAALLHDGANCVHCFAREAALNLRAALAGKAES